MPGTSRALDVAPTALAHNVLITGESPAPRKQPWENAYSNLPEIREIASGPQDWPVPL